LKKNISTADHQLGFGGAGEKAKSSSSLWRLPRGPSVVDRPLPAANGSLSSWVRLLWFFRRTCFLFSMGTMNPYQGKWGECRILPGNIEYFFCRTLKDNEAFSLGE